MISPAQLRYVQSLGEKWMVTNVTIYHKAAFALDPSNPYGDDTIESEPDPVTVKGWMTSTLGKTVDAYQAQVIALGQFKLRVPFGTLIEPEDHVVINGQRFGVVDTARESSWQEWLTCSLTRNTP